jgi:flavin reductase (DIM6/NTAB) family NADH-FMN oxidoreductase RutF
MQAGTHPSFPEAFAAPQAFKRALSAVPTGVAVVTSCARDGRYIGLTVNSLASISLEPPLVSWALRLNSPILDEFRARQAFVVNLLSAEQASLSARFASAVAERFDRVGIAPSRAGLPRIEGCAAYLECTLHADFIVGDHALFVGAVHAAESSDKAALGYCRGRYFASATVA